MNEIDRFREQLDALGADMATWPADERAAAERLLARSEEARRALAGAARLDERLRRAAGGSAGMDLRARILAIPAVQPRSRRARGGMIGWLTMPWRAGVAAAAASLLLGVALGSTGQAPLDDVGGAFEVAALGFPTMAIPEDLP